MMHIFYKFDKHNSGCCLLWCCGFALYYTVIFSPSICYVRYEEWGPSGLSLLNPTVYVGAGLLHTTSCLGKCYITGAHDMEKAQSLLDSTRLVWVLLLFKVRDRSKNGKLL